MNRTKLVLSLLVFAASAAFADDAAVIALGKTKYALCGACHGITGNGQPAPGLTMAPSFLDSELVKADPEVAAVILFKGIKKEDPAAYMGQIMMPLGAGMSDEDVAGLISYVRAEFGKIEGPAVTAEQVKEWREKHAAAEMPTRAELIELGAAAAEAE